MNARVMTDKVQELQKRATETAKDVAETADRYVHENAWKSIAFAAVIGCIIGYFLAGRRD